VLVVGCVHGNEPAGEAITRQLRNTKPPPGVALWLVDEFNPDGCQANTRQNARGVDLNRNSPWHWRPLDHLGGTYYSGPGPLSEPESKAINRLVIRLRPAISIWYHQHAALVDHSSGGDPTIERRYAELVGLPFSDYGREPGSIATWQDQTFPGATAFVVELPAGPLSAQSVVRHVSAVLAIAGGGGSAAGNAPGD
jgi:protein MpaA